MKLANQQGKLCVLQTLREQLSQAEASAGESARTYHGDFTKGLRVGFALALKMLEQPEYFPVTRMFGEVLWNEIRRESQEFEDQTQQTQTGKG